MHPPGGKARLSPNAPYGLASVRPLHILVFLLPLIVAYEVGSMVYLGAEARGADTIGARGMLGSFFENFGAASLHLPAIALAVVLFAWHVFLGDPWNVRGRVVVGMALESATWAIPLLVFALLLNPVPAAAGTSPDADAFSWQSRLAISLGAGIYEELLFRLILITAVHFVLVDLLRFAGGVGFVVAAVVSAVSFAFYHNIGRAGGQVDLRLLVFYTAAGLYFASLYIWRGFGIVVAAHAVYDAFALLLFSRGAEGG